ncbi:MAG: hypothetical protein AB2L11_08115 [Syntrophobacteraceae bacterium]
MVETVELIDVGSEVAVATDCGNGGGELGDLTKAGSSGGETTGASGVTAVGVTMGDEASAVRVSGEVPALHVNTSLIRLISPSNRAMRPASFSIFEAAAEIFELSLNSTATGIPRQKSKRTKTPSTVTLLIHLSGLEKTEDCR